MYAVHGCGCVTRSNYALSRCKVHDALVHTVVNTTPDTNPKRWAGDRSTVILNDLRDSLIRMSPQSVNYIVSYPNQSEFWARSNTHFLNMPDQFFSEYKKVLRDDGLAILFVEQSCISAVTYLAHLHNFNVNSISLARIDCDLPISCYHTDEHKFCIVLSKGGNDTTLGNFRFKSESKLFDLLPRGTVLDVTCHMPKIILNARRSKHRVIGFCYDFDVFKYIVTELRKAE